jgi:TPR repeat protein
MKTALLLGIFLGAISLQAQVGTSPRTLTRRIEPLVRPQPPRAMGNPNQNGAPAPVSKAPLSVEEKEQKKLEQSAEEKKKLQWQMERAEKGSDPAQYALAMRYINGDGVEKDPVRGLKWLKESAKQDNGDAKKKLAEWKESHPDDFAKAEEGLKKFEEEKKNQPAAAETKKN